MTLSPRRRRNFGAARYLWIKPFRRHLPPSQLSGSSVPEAGQMRRSRTHHKSPAVQTENVPSYLLRRVPSCLSYDVSKPCVERTGKSVQSRKKRRGIHVHVIKIPDGLVVDFFGQYDLDDRRH